MADYDNYGYDQAQANQQTLETEHHASWTHELLASGAAAWAMDEYDKKSAEKSGGQVNHRVEKDVLAGLAAAGIDHFAEGKGLDWFDKEKAQHDAKKAAQGMYDSRAQQQDPSYDPNA